MKEISIRTQIPSRPLTLDEQARLQQFDEHKDEIMAEFESLKQRQEESLRRRVNRPQRASNIILRNAS